MIGRDQQAILATVGGLPVQYHALDPVRRTQIDDDPLRIEMATLPAGVRIAVGRGVDRALLARGGAGGAAECAVALSRIAADSVDKTIDAGGDRRS